MCFTFQALYYWFTLVKFLWYLHRRSWIYVDWTWVWLIRLCWALLYSLCVLLGVCRLYRCILCQKYITHVVYAQHVVLGWSCYSCGSHLSLSSLFYLACWDVQGLTVFLCALLVTLNVRLSKRSIFDYLWWRQREMKKIHNTLLLKVLVKLPKSLNESIGHRNFVVAAFFFRIATAL